MSWLRIAVALIVTMIWAAGYIAAIVDRTFSPPAEVSGVMLGVVTWLFGAEVKKRLSEGVSVSIGKKDEPAPVEPSDVR